MKNIIKNILRLLLFLPLGPGLKAQYIPNSGAYQWKGGEFLQSLQIPTGCGGPVSGVNAPDASRAAVYFDSCNDALYKFNPKIKTWSVVGNGGALDTLFLDARYLPNGLISPGYVTWSGTGLIFNVTSAVYTINKKRYTSPDGSVTLDAADPALPRYDIIGVDTLGQIVKVTGTPNANPVIPQINPASQLALTIISIPAGATVPGNINQNIVYDENTEAYAVTASGISIDANSTADFYHGAKSINAASAGGVPYIDFTLNSGTVSASQFSTLNFFLKNKNQLIANTQVLISFFNGATQVSGPQAVNVKQSANWVNYTLSMAAFNFTNTTFNNIRFNFNGTTAGFYLDYVQLQSGTAPPSLETDPVAINKTITVNGVSQKLNDNPVFTTGGGVNASAQKVAIGRDSAHLTYSGLYYDTANNYLGIGKMPTWKFHMFYSQPRGAVSYTNGSTAVTGAGTDFQRDLHVQQTVYVGGVYNSISGINSPTSLTLGAASTITASGVKFIMNDSLINGSFQIANNGDIYRDNNPILKIDGGNAGNIAVGENAMLNNVSSSRNTAFGNQALMNSASSSSNVAIGCQAMRYSNGSQSIGIGFLANYNNQGNNNVAVGFGSLDGSGSGGQNSGLGAFSLAALTDGGYNTAIGYNALNQVSIGNTNTAVGYNALAATTTASNNTAVGGNALVNNNTGTSNTGIGYYSLFSAGTGVASVTVTNGGSGYTGATTIDLYGTNPELGQATAVPVIVGGVITAINVTFQSAGYKSAPVVTINPNGPGSGATAVANLTGTPQQNTAIGENAGWNNYRGVGNVYIGNNVRGKVNGSNKLYISNQNDSSSSLIYGDFSARTLNINGTLNLQAGTALLPSLVIPPGVYASVPVNGAVENDGNHLKYTAQGVSYTLATRGKSVSGITTATTLTPDAGTYDAFKITALATLLTINAPTGTVNEMHELIIRITDNGTPRAIIWNAVYRQSSDLLLPLTTTSGKTMYLKFYWNSDSTTWDFVSFLNGF